MKNFSIVIPAYNEEDNIPLLLDQIFNSLKETQYNYEVIIVDDNSTDNTYTAFLQNLNIKNKKIIRNNKNYGQSKSILFGIQKASHENIVTLDADLQNDPLDIIKLAKCYFNSNEYKMVAGIRTIRRDSYLKILSSKIANKVRAFILKDNCPDTGCSLKIFKKKIFLNFKFFDGIHRFLPALFIGNNFKIKYIDVNHRHRINGISKYGTVSRMIWGIRDIFKVKMMISKANKK